MVQRIFSIIVLPLLTLVAIGCSDSTGPADGKGTVRVVMTDAPFPINLVAEANVSIERVEIRSKSADSDSGFTIVTDIDTILNLVDLRNGITAQLGELDLGPGIYDEIRLITGDAEIILTDDTRFDLKVPSGSQTGIKIKIKNDLTVEEGKVVEVLLDAAHVRRADHGLTLAGRRGRGGRGGGPDLANPVQLPSDEQEGGLAERGTRTRWRWTPRAWRRDSPWSCIETTRWWAADASSPRLWSVSRSSRVLPCCGKRCQRAGRAVWF